MWPRALKGIAGRASMQESKWEHAPKRLRRGCASPLGRRSANAPPCLHAGKIAIGKGRSRAQGLSRKNKGESAPESGTTFRAGASSVGVEPAWGVGDRASVATVAEKPFHITPKRCRTPCSAPHHRFSRGANNHVPRITYHVIPLSMESLISSPGPASPAANTFQFPVLVSYLIVYEPPPLLVRVSPASRDAPIWLMVVVVSMPLLSASRMLVAEVAPAIVHEPTASLLPGTS